MNNRSDTVVAITGASSGIGEATAHFLADAGFRVVVGARRLEKLQSIVDAIGLAGGSAAMCRLDVTDLDSMHQFVDVATSRFGRLDVIVNNAGIMPLSRLDTLNVGDWNRMIDVNIRGVLHGVAAALPIFKQQGSGHIINVASTGAYSVSPMTAVYSATKAAVRAITEGIRLEHDDIRATIISPGAVTTEIFQKVTDPEAAKMSASFAEDGALDASAIARAIHYAITQPADCDVSELIVRPTKGSAV